MTLDLHGPDRLVFELNEIVGIEEIIFEEPRVADFFRVAIESARATQGLNLFRVRQPGHRVCKYNYAAHCID